MSLKNKYHGMLNTVGGNNPSHSLPHVNRFKVNSDEIYLSDLSERDKSWDRHRWNSDRIADYYRDIEEFQNYADRIDFCSQLLDFCLVVEEQEYKLKLDMARFCRVRHCSVCQYRRSFIWKAKAYKILPSVVKAYPKYRWLFLTLTVRNCRIAELRNTLQWMNESWRRMNQRKKFPAVGWIRSTEVTRGKDGSTHPHFHSLLLVKPFYFSGKSYMKQKEWVEMWRSCLRIDYAPVVDIRAIKRGHSPNELVPEILKYTVKESDLVADREWFLELTRQMYKMRTVASGGVLKKYLRELEKEPEDLIGRNETKTEDEISEGHLIFKWKSEDRKYKLLD